MKNNEPGLRHYPDLAIRDAQLSEKIELIEEQLIAIETSALALLATVKKSTEVLRSDRAID